MKLSNKEIERYSRQLILSSWSEAKQLALKNAQIAIDTRLASAAYYLVAAGAENLFLFGSDAENLQSRLLELNPSLKLAFNPKPTCKYDFAISILPHQILALQSATIARHFQIQNIVRESRTILLNDEPLLVISGAHECFLRLKAGALLSAMIMGEFSAPTLPQLCIG